MAAASGMGGLRVGLGPDPGPVISHQICRGNQTFLGRGVLRRTSAVRVRTSTDYDEPPGSHFEKARDIRLRTAEGRRSPSHNGGKAPRPGDQPSSNPVRGAVIVLTPRTPSPPRPACI